MACDPSNEIERYEDNVIQIPVLEDAGIACVEVQPGDTIILPFHVSTADISDDMPVRARILDDALVIEQAEGATIFLEGFLPAEVAGEVVLTGIGRTPVDAALWLAATDPGLTISH